jgi:hypothetical protein
LGNGTIVDGTIVDGGVDGTIVDGGVDGTIVDGGVDVASADSGGLGVSGKQLGVDSSIAMSFFPACLPGARQKESCVKF